MTNGRKEIAVFEGESMDPFKEFFCYTDWHHTWKYATETDFYGLDFYSIKDFTNDLKEHDYDYI